jgi:hypothetical protein
VKAHSKEIFVRFSFKSIDAEIIGSIISSRFDVAGVTN